MKEYKTIVNSIDYSGVFDVDINQAVQEGWVVTERQVVRGVDSEYSSFRYKTQLVAFLEREV